MNIEYKSKMIKFSKLIKGEPFEYNSSVHMKIGTADASHKNAVVLFAGEMTFFEPDTDVVYLKSAYVVIER